MVKTAVGYPLTANPPASPSIGMELRKAVRILYKICGEAATTTLSPAGLSN